MFLYHVSIDLFHDGKFIPRVPPLIEEGDSEDWSTPRICFSRTLAGCLGSIPDGGRGLRDFCESGRTKGSFKVFTLNLDIVDCRYLTPEDLKYKVPDALIHEEYWVLDPLYLGKGEIIRVLDFEVDEDTDRVSNLKYRKECPRGLSSVDPIGKMSLF